MSMRAGVNERGHDIVVEAVGIVKDVRVHAMGMKCEHVLQAEECWRGGLDLVSQTHMGQPLACGLKHAPRMNLVLLSPRP